MTVVNFMFGHLWFGPFFGKIWKRIHNVDCDNKKQMKEMMKGIWKIMVSELVSTFLIMTGLACVINAIPEYTGVQNAFMIWLAFVLPITVSNVIWGNDKKSDMVTKVAITAGYRLIPLLVAGYVLSVWL